MGRLIEAGYHPLMVPGPGDEPYVDVVADKAHRAGGEDGNGLGLEIVVGFLNGLFQLFLTAENDLLVLHVR